MIEWQTEISEKVGKLIGKVDEVDKKLTNHLQHHFLLEICLVGGLVGLIGVVLSLVFR